MEERGAYFDAADKWTGKHSSDMKEIRNLTDIDCGHSINQSNEQSNVVNTNHSEIVEF